jgi:hypothetical protein
MENISGYVDLTQDKGVMKKTLIQGFSKDYPRDNEQVIINYKAESQDGTFIEASHLIDNEEFKAILGSYNIIPGLEIAIKTMKMGEKAKVRITPEYGYIAKEKLKSGELKDIKDLVIDYPPIDEIKKLETKDAKKYLTLFYEIELIKFDKVRISKSQMDTNQKIEEAVLLKNAGNELVKENRYREAIIKYETGLDYISKVPTNDLTSKVYDLRHHLYLNITMCHNNLHEYNYSLKRVIDAFNIKASAKCYYYRSV